VGVEDLRAGHVFICYAREDAPQVDWLQRRLDEAGIPVWRDKFDIWPGEDWRTMIRRAISDRALVFIACFSRQSLRRDEGYQNEELTLAIEQLRLRPPERPWLIPIRFDACEIPDRDVGGGRTLGSIQRTDLFGPDGEEEMVRLVRSVRRILGLELAGGQPVLPIYDKLSGCEAFEASPPRSWARLLDPRRELVSFVGRENELRALTAWCEGSDADRLRLVTGPGGVGKTRLAVELAERMKKRGWVCQRIADGQEASAIAELRTVTSSRALLVVDYAETRVGLRQMLKALVRRDQGDGVRVLLLARAIGDWWDRLGASEPAAWDLIQSASLVHSPLSAVVAADLSDAEIVALAVRAFAAELGVPDREVEIYGHGGTVQRRVLDLHAAALVAVLAEAKNGVVRVDLGTVLRELLRHEQHFWYESAQANELSGGPDGVTAEQLRQLVAAACLVGAANQAEARALPGRVPGTSSSAKIAGWLRLLYPPDPGSTEWIGSVQPDRLAELHTMQELVASREFALDCLTGLDARQGVRAVALLARASSDYPEAEHLLSRILPDMAESLAEMDAPAETLAAILGAIPYPTVVLGPAAVSLGQRITQGLPAETEPAVRAHWLTSLSDRLSAMRRHHDALIAAEEAVAIRRDLAASSKRYLPELTSSLMSLGVVLSDLGRDEDALSVAQECAAILRELAADDADRYGPDLASAIADLGQRLFALGAFDEALQATEQAVAIRRELVVVEPDRHRPNLATSLDSLGVRLSALGRHAAAIPVTEEAALIRRQLAEVDPDRYRPDLANSLGNLGISYSDLDRHADALPLVEEVLEIRRELAAADPDRWRPDLASAMENLSVTLVDLDRSAEAVPLAEQVLVIRRELAAVNPDRWARELACALGNLAAALIGSGQLAGSLELCLEALAISRTLTAGRGKPDLSKSLGNVGAVLFKLGRRAEALPFIEESVALCRGLAAAFPARFRPALAGDLASLETALSGLNRPQDALLAIEENSRSAGISPRTIRNGTCPMCPPRCSGSASYCPGLTDRLTRSSRNRERS
jgi:tetratricopeptide (TPR) repeat protein